LKQRCQWSESDPLYIRYHDEEWGVPEYDEQALFAKLLLDGAQAGLSWLTILKKRKGYYKAFDNFEPERIARYDRKRIETLLSNREVVRNRLKIEAAVRNAQAFLELRSEGLSFSSFLWEFVGGSTRHNHWQHISEVPPKTDESEKMSLALKDRGFRFVGPTICYAFMQAVGMVNDHLVHCFRHRELLERQGLWRRESDSEGQLRNA
jgi:DNA-3-methyladenine glycosylase I